MRTLSRLLGAGRVFLATHLSQGEAQRDLEEQGMRAAWFTRSDVQSMIADGKSSDGKTVAAFALLLMRD